MTYKEKFDSFKRKFRLDSHHAMERFGIVFSIFAVAASLVAVGTVTSSVSNNVQLASETALYTPTFQTSKTGLSGKVQGVYTSGDRTQALVLMNFGSDAATKMSANANNYQAFLTGTDMNLVNQPLDQPVTGSIVVFGTSGYMGVILESEKPFTQQIMNLTVRANSELVYKESESSKVRSDLKDDASFTKYDQWRVYVNPGASEAIETSSLSGSNAAFSPVDAYYELVTMPAETEVRATLDSKLANLQVDLAKIDEYTAQAAITEVGGVRLITPAPPMQIAGDVVTGTPQKEDGSAPDEPLTLKTDWVSPEGYDFDWRSGSVKEGYLDEMVPEGTSYVSYLAAKQTPAKGSSAASFSTNSLSWKLTDGSDLTKDYQNSDTTMKPLIDLMNNLTQAYQGYYTDKVAYQTTELEALIKLEVGLLNVDSSSTLNTKANALVIY